MVKKNDNNFLNDMSKFASDAFSSAAHFKREASEYIRNVVDSLVKKMNFATKDEMHLIEKVVTQAKQDVADIKKMMGLHSTSTTKSAPKKTKVSKSKTPPLDVKKSTLKEEKTIKSPRKTKPASKKKSSK